MSHRRLLCCRACHPCPRSSAVSSALKAVGNPIAESTSDATTNEKKNDNKARKRPRDAKRRVCRLHFDHLRRRLKTRGVPERQSCRGKVPAILHPPGGCPPAHLTGSSGDQGRTK